MQLERFLSLAREGKLLELEKYFAIDEDPIYGVLVHSLSFHGPSKSGIVESFLRIVCSEAHPEDIQFPEVILI